MAGQAGVDPIQLVYLDEAGTPQRGCLSACWDRPFELVGPIRSFPAFKGQKNFTSRWWTATTGDHVGYESWLERAEVIRLDFMPSVVGIASQPFKICWREGRRERVHTRSATSISPPFSVSDPSTPPSWAFSRVQRLPGVRKAVRRRDILFTWQVSLLVERSGVENLDHLKPARTPVVVSAATPHHYLRIRVRPGELVEIDSTPLDVMVVLDDGTPGRVELTGIVDLATRTIPAAVLRPAAKSVDACLLLARAVTPEPMRPGWSDALRMSRSALPHRHLLELDQRFRHAAARPVIVPETIVFDGGKVFVSNNFRTACRSLGISLQPAHPGTPTDKPHIERTIGSVGTLFCQFVSGYLGSSVERRGAKVEAEPLWSMLQLQELLDEWIVSHWQNRPHDGLRDPSAPGRPHTPNEKYAALLLPRATAPWRSGPRTSSSFCRPPGVSSTLTASRSTTGCTTAPSTASRAPP